MSAAAPDMIVIPALPVRRLTEAIPCQQCGAQAGQACRDANGAPVPRSVGSLRVHLGRAQ